MRLDKFLQVSRLVRRRALANSLCHAGRVVLNGRPALPAADVRPGDVIAIEVGARRIRARVRALPTSRQAGEESVEVLEDQALE
ncbi:MAG: RNA-binding S4 domain-containing protein [Bacillati bacterium ANGP1]|uniref:RNA-binding S4 domain-containing protein n=1 Tax=Candidatus Segetimicrobium genomatis TaxID=2569760 RepID=A0A537JH06_9BACT|nr:MAG: RNA-binding S4 domain-containing protein [Terrabacteria group bacterium ANGP1]